MNPPPGFDKPSPQARFNAVCRMSCLLLLIYFLQAINPPPGFEVNPSPSVKLPDGARNPVCLSTPAATLNFLQLYQWTESEVIKLIRESGFGEDEMRRFESIIMMDRSRFPSLNGIQLCEILGAGGFGIVFKGFNVSIGRYVSCCLFFCSL